MKDDRRRLDRWMILGTDVGRLGRSIANNDEIGQWLDLVSQPAGQPIGRQKESSMEIGKRDEKMDRRWKIETRNK